MLKHAEIGRKIRELRASRGLTQRELAAAVGASEPTIRNYELGNRTPDNAQLDKIAAALGVDPEILIIPKIESTAVITQVLDLLNSGEIGRIIRNMRKERGLTQTELAERLGKALRTVQKYEKCEIEIPLSIMCDIFHILGTDNNEKENCYE